MKEVTGNIWKYWEAGAWITITTNGMTRRDGACVMGRGVAKEAAQRIPTLPYLLGATLRDRSWTEANIVHTFPAHRIITFPVKHHWRDQADLALIARSARQLSNLSITKADGGLVRPIYLVRPGCGNGGLEWQTVKPILAPLLDDRFIVVERDA